MDPTEGVLWDYTNNKKIYVCPNDKFNFRVSYAMNKQAHFHPRAMVDRPSEKLVIMEELGIKDDKVTYTNDGCFSYWIAENWKDYIRNGHTKGSVYSYADGHVTWEIMPIEKTWEFATFIMSWSKINCLLSLG